ncbi:hypothetical protein [Methanolobus sp. WCC5]|uniref:hypothetical protein n=1 Tax=Methanolobus sp. WCC5 TaxID=3125785 RepID=UPI00324F7768
MPDIPRLLSYIGRFSLLHVIIYSLFAYIFLSVLNIFPESWKIALEFFEPYRYPAPLVILSQFIRGILLAIIIYPFYETIVKGKHGLLALFVTLWGLGLLASVEPMPGSIEGMIYTQTSFIEHLIVLIAVAIQSLIFCIIFLQWERSGNIRESVQIQGLQLKDALKRGYIKRFTLIHIITYWIIGMTFYQLQGYEEALATMEVFELYRPLESFFMVAVVFLGQIVRGIILALLIYPFYITFREQQHGWLLLFGLLWFITGIGSVFFTPELLGSIITGEGLGELLHEMRIGIPEITTQMLLFSWLFCKYDRRNS